MKGHCLCGAITFEAEGTPVSTLHCYCESCRRATSSPVTTFLTVKRAALTFAGNAPGVYVSSPGVERWFCETCGSPLGYVNEKDPKDFDLYAASLDDPASVKPEFHVYDAERLPWIALSDTLPRHSHGSDA